MADERSPLLSTKSPEFSAINSSGPVAINETHEVHAEVHVYKRRWWIVLVFSLVAMTQAAQYNTYGPIADSCKHAFNWSDGEVALLTTWGLVTFAVSMLPFAWILDVKGLRVATLLTITLMLISAILKCIPVMPPLLTWLANLGQIFAGLGGPVCMSAPPLLSSHWFPPHQRATATAIMANSGWMGLAVSFLLGPRLVSEHNMTGLNISVQRLYAAQERNDIRFFMYLEGGWTALLFLAVLVYFPNSPPKPPSKSAAVERLDFKDGLRQLVRHRRLWLVGLSFSIALGVFNAWNTMLDVNLNGLLGISQTEAGSLACYAVIGGAVFGFFLAVFADVFSGHLRLMLLVLFTLGVGFITWFCILCDGFIPFSSVSLYLSCIVGGTFVSASVPLFYELACETTYPIAEGITGGFISWLLNICGIPFLIVTMIPNLSQFWMNWAFLAAIILPIPLLLLFKEKYTRLTLDDSEDTDTDIQKASVPVIT